MRTAAWMSVLVAIVAAGCNPGVQDCRALMPIGGEAITIVTAPSGAPGCATVVDGVSVVTELHRERLRWRVGRTWVDGRPTPADELHSAIASVRARRDIESRVAAAQAAAETSIAKAKEVGTQLLEKLRKK